MQYTQHSDKQMREMLATIGVNGIDALFSPIPQEQRFRGPLNIPEGVSEPELLAELGRLAALNRSTDEQSCFLGMGAYDHFIPTIVDHLAMRGEFLTAYTPYQAEASQGVLQAFYEFQTMICQLTGMQIANASLYESASAAAEAAGMARSITRRDDVLVSAACHPDTVATLETYARQQQSSVSTVAMRDGATDLERLASQLNESVAAVVVQWPNAFGIIEDLEAIVNVVHEHGALAIVSYDPIASGLLKRPGDLDADIVVGEGQPLGIELQYGAPYLGFLACREAYLRKVPGRIVGTATDNCGRKGFCLVLQTREQHIKRERATSNVCTNQGLMAMRATVYLSAMGRSGIKKVASLCFDKAHYAARQIAQLDGYKLRFEQPFFKEFVVQTTRGVDRAMDRCREQGILAGVPLGRWFDELNDCFVIAVTEKRTKTEIDRLVSVLDAV